MNDNGLPPVINDAFTAVCEVSHTEHLVILFTVQLIVQFSLALINYFGFTKNPNVKSSTLFEFFINVLRSLMTAIFKRRSV